MAEDLSLGITRSRLLDWWRRGEPGACIGLAVLLALLMRLPLLGVPVYPDEGGYLLVAQHWDGGGPFMYGDYFVDRPPLLFVPFRLAEALGGVHALRLIAAVLVAVMVMGAGWARDGPVG